MKRIAIIMVAALTIALGFGIAIADPQDAQSTVGASGQYTVTAANSVSTQGGNVTAVDVQSDQSTQKWQGFWGNVSGNLRLGDGTDVFYDWSSVSFTAVYATPDNSIDWTSITNLTAGDMNAKDGDFGFAPADPDSLTSTFTLAGCSAGTMIGGAAGVYTLDNTSANSAWQTCIAEDSGATATDTVFGTNIMNAGSTAFNGDNVQYQMMVPTTGQLYYFYLEL